MASVAPAIVNPYRGSPAPPRPRETRPLTRSSIDRIRGLRGVGAGRRLLIVASGPTVARVDFSGLDRGTSDVLIVNRPYQPLMDLAKWWAVNDMPVVMKHLDQIRAFKGTFICGSSAFIPGRDSIKVPALAGRGFSMDLSQGFYLGRSTTLSSLQVAGWMDYASIFVLGCDMSAEGNLYHDGSAPLGMTESTRKKRFDTEAEYWAYAAKSMPVELRQKTTFVGDLNPYPFVRLFNRATDLSKVVW